MPSKVDIANRALRKVGAGRITSFTQGNKNANVVNDIYDELLDSLLAMAKWKFATVRVQLAQSATAPTYEFDHAYVLPSDWIRTVKVNDNDIGLGTVLARQEEVNGQNVLASSEDEVFLLYIKRQTDPNIMTANFRNAFTLALARDFAIPIASSNALFDRLAGEANRALLTAMSIDSTGSFPQSRPRGSWIDSRTGWR